MIKCTNMSDYIYLGDKLTRDSLKGRECNAVRRGGKCIRGGYKMLVSFDGNVQNVISRRLRKIKTS
jgi:hypothetical protein